MTLIVRLFPKLYKGWMRRCCSQGSPSSSSLSLRALNSDTSRQFSSEQLFLCIFTEFNNTFLKIRLSSTTSVVAHHQASRVPAVTCLAVLRNNRGAQRPDISQYFGRYGVHELDKWQSPKALAMSPLTALVRHERRLRRGSYATPSIP